MEVIIQKFIEDIQHFSIAELRTLCIELKRENEKLNSVLSAYRASDTDLARDYQTAQSTISDLRQQLNKLQNNYNHIAAQNDLLNHHRFGYHNEKLGLLHFSYYLFLLQKLCLLIALYQKHSLISFQFPLCLQ